MAELRPHVLTLTAAELVDLLAAVRLFSQANAAITDTCPLSSGDLRRLGHALGNLGQRLEGHRQNATVGCCRG